MSFLLSLHSYVGGGKQESNSPPEDDMPKSVAATQTSLSGEARGLAEKQAQEAQCVVYSHCTRVTRDFLNLADQTHLCPPAAEGSKSLPIGKDETADDGEGMECSQLQSEPCNEMPAKGSEPTTDHASTKRAIPPRGGQARADKVIACCDMSQRIS